MIDAAASDNAEVLIRAALPQPKEQQRPRYDQWGNEIQPGDDPQRMPPGSGDGGMGRGSGRGGGRGGRGGSGSDAAGNSGGYGGRETSTAWGRMRPFDYLAYFALPPAQFEIQQDTARVRVGSANHLRTYLPGDDEAAHLTDRYGSRSLRGGWVGDAFVISTEDSKTVSMTESLRRLRDDRLDRVIDLRVTGAKKIIIHSVYRRASAADSAAAAEIGPPAPGR